MGDEGSVYSVVDNLDASRVLSMTDPQKEKEEKRKTFVVCSVCCRGRSGERGQQTDADK